MSVIYLIGIVRQHTEVCTIGKLYTYSLISAENYEWSFRPIDYILEVGPGMRVRLRIRGLPWSA